MQRQTATEILERHINTGLTSAHALFDHAWKNAPEDSVVRARAIKFEPSDTGVVMTFAPGDYRHLHKHALTQVAAKAGIPSAYLSELNAGVDWQRDLGATIMREHFANDPAKYLVRSVAHRDGKQVRGFLSDRYRRLDSRPLLHAFAEECDKLGAKPVSGVISDTRLAVKAILPTVYEPVPGEALAFGVEWGNSDFGSAKHTVRAFILRLWCLNGATTENALSEVHLGKQLSDDIEFSQRTYELDTRHSISALRDIVRGTLAERKVQNHITKIQQAAADGVDWKRAGTMLGKRLNKGELAKAKEHFEGPDVVNLPPGNTMWRVSNVISWLAGSTEDADRRLELERVAGEVINGRSDAA